jgi:hypothetical protein
VRPRALAALALVLVAVLACAPASAEAPPAPPTPNSNFTLLGSPRVNPKTGAVTFKLSVADAGTLAWVLTFQNGKFGVYAASMGTCGKGLVRLRGICRPVRIVFAKGIESVSTPGTVTFTVKPSASARQALRRALQHRKGLPVMAVLVFRSSLGGAPVIHTRSLTVRLKKRK